LNKTAHDITFQARIF
jgi:hypothetical protein